MSGQRKIRTEFRKKHQVRVRRKDLTREFAGDEGRAEDRAVKSERISGKGDLTRKRTVVGHETDEGRAGLAVVPAIDPSMQRGTVLAMHGLTCTVQADDGRILKCTVGGVLKDLSTDQRHILAAGDVVYFRPERQTEGMIERVEPRRSVLCRTSKGRQQVLVANVDQVLIVSSAAEPALKPNLIDRLLVEAERVRLPPIICLNKIDLVDPADLMPLAGVYGQMGYRVVLASAAAGMGIEELRRDVQGKSTVLAGQSGVGKSSLLNAIEPELGLKVGVVSAENQKGKHTTTAARLIPLAMGGYVVDTPGIRQFQLWDVIPEEVAGYYRDIRPYVSHCRFPDCTHQHEADCAVKDAVADGRLDARRYESYCHLYAGDDA